MASVTVELPPAPPSSYLRWMAFWRDVESAMLSHPRINEIASRESAPFLADDVARFLSIAARVIRDAAYQAGGRTEVSPVLEAPRDPAFLDRCASYIERRGAWLDVHGDAVGIDPLEADLRVLRAQVIDRFRRVSPP